MTFDTSACARRNFSRLFLSPVGLGQSTMWYDWWTEEDMAFERRSGWAESAGNKPVVRWQNGLWNGLAFFLSIGTERNEFRTNGPKWKIVHLTGPNWTDGNLSCKGRAKNSEIPNSSSQRQAGSSTGSSRIAFLWYSFILRYTCQLSRLRRESHACGLKTSISRLRANFSRLIEKCELLPSYLTQFPKIC